MTSISKLALSLLGVYPPPLISKDRPVVRFKSCGFGTGTMCREKKITITNASWGSQRFSWLSRLCGGVRLSCAHFSEGRGLWYHTRSVAQMIRRISKVGHRAPHVHTRMAELCWHESRWTRCRRLQIVKQHGRKEEVGRINRFRLARNIYLLIVIPCGCQVAVTIDRGALLMAAR